MSVFTDEVLLIHIPKCGGTSCRDWMLDNLRGAVINSLEDGPLPIDSTPLRHIEEYADRPLSSWELIVIPVRDPYAQVLSHWCYHWNRYAIGGRHIHDETAAIHKTLHAWLLEPHSDFRVWYESRIRGNGSLQGAMDRLQPWGFYQYYATTDDGQVPENVVFVPLDNLTDEFPRLLAPYVDGEPTPFPHARSSPHSGKPFRYMNAVSLDIVHHRFRWAFQRFYSIGRV